MDLTCYVMPGWEPRLRPASPRRDWMEETPERFAYRCLPLAIANAHGWEVLSPCGFEARWNGGKSVEAVEIRLDPGTPEHKAPVSLFGQGTVTFHIEGILRTPEGWNLWVGGSPNAAKDGIAPLGGVIETDWSPFTFTMNWRFTRPGHWVRFEENEPFCFLFPVPRRDLLEVEPKIRPIEEEPELKRQFQKWSRSRDEFQARMREEQPAAPADKWQKLYYRGVDSDGNPGAPDHNAKLRLQPFRMPDGSAMAPLEPKACPVAHAPAPKPAASPAALKPDAIAAIARYPGFDITLARLGFDARPEPAAQAPALPLKAAPAPAPAPKADALALRRRDWILRAQERQRALSQRTGGVRRVRRIGAEEFLDQFYAPGRPVVIEGEIDDWPALSRWTPAYLREAVGAAEIEVQAGRDGSAEFELFKDEHKTRMPFDRFVERIASEPGNDLYLTAYNSAANARALAPLAADLGRLDKFLTGAPGMVWIGPAGTFTPLHFDLTNNLLVQLVGGKRLVLVPPSETAAMANHRHVFSRVHDLDDPERLRQFPAAKDVRRLEVELNPGELLFIPVGWWHQVAALDFSVTLTHTDFRWPNEAWRDFPEG